jgi:hypothetical protein
MPDWGEMREAIIEKRGANCGYCGVWRSLVTGFEGKVENDSACSLHVIEKCESCGDEAQDIYHVDEDY